MAIFEIYNFFYYGPDSGNIFDVIFYQTFVVVSLSKVLMWVNSFKYFLHCSLRGLLVQALLFLNNFLKSLFLVLIDVIIYHALSKACSLVVFLFWTLVARVHAYQGWS